LSLLGYDAIPLEKLFTTFLRNMVPSSSRDKYVGLFDPEHEGTIFCGNIRNHSPNNTASHPKRLDFFLSLRWSTSGLDG